MKRYIKASSPVSVEDRFNDVWKSSVEECGVDYHFMSKDEANNLRRVLDTNLRDAGLDYSYKDYGDIILKDFLGDYDFTVHISGNTQGISTKIVQEASKCGWHKVDNIPIDSQMNSFYKAEGIGGHELISEEYASRLLGMPTGFTHHGIGSQAYDDEHGRTVYIDDDGNVLISTYVFRWD